MSEPTPPRRRFRFANFELDLKSAVLRQDGRPIRLRPQTFRILALLVARAGELVTREEIQAEIWRADTFVDFNQGLNACIRQLREALGDDAEAPRFIETAPRLGYRFIAPIEPAQPPVTGETAAESSQAPARARPRWVLRAAAIGGLALVAVIGAWRYWPAHAEPNRPRGAIRSIVVLPLANLTGGQDHTYLADGMTEALINELAAIRGLRVISRTSSMQYRDSRQPIPEIVRDLQVDAVIEGSVQATADRVRITVSLIDGATDQPLWANSYDRSLKDVLTLQREVTGAILSELRAEIPVAGGEHRTAARSIDPAAYQAYLKGRFFWNKRSKTGYETAIKHFEEAIRLAPDYAPAYAGLGDALALHTSAENLPRDEGYGRAARAARHALALDETLAEAHTSLGFILQKHSYDWAGAERAFVRALELNPNYATAHHWRGINFNLQGRFSDAYEEMRAAVANDPLSYAINVDFAVTQARVGKCDEAFEHAQKTVQMHEAPQQHASFLGSIPLYCGRYEQAITLLEQGEDADPVGNKRLGTLGYAYARAGRTAKARQILLGLRKKNEKSVLILVAEIHAALGERDAAFEALNRLYDSRDERILYLHLHPMLDPIRSDPRFQSLLRRLNLLAGP